MRIVGYHIAYNMIANSDGEYLEYGDVPDDGLAAYWLSFLLQDKPDAIKVLYHLNYSAAQLLRMLKVGPQSGRLLMTASKLKMSPEERFELGYISGKYISVKEFDRFTGFSDMYQYHRQEVIDGEPTIEVCLQKASEAQAVGEDVYQALCKMGLHPDTLTSPIRVWEKQVLASLDLPTVDDMPQEAAELAYKCCHGGWMEAFQRGYWEQACDYDIKSAYPFQLSRLPDTRRGSWMQSGTVIPAATIGFLDGEITIDTDFSPIMYEAGTDRKYTPRGTWETVITLGEYNFINRHGLGNFVLRDGWFWQAESFSRPLYHPIRKLYGDKERSTGLQREVAKRIANGIYGKMLESRRDHTEFGEHFNPVWGALTESRTRLAVAEFCLQAMKAGINVLHVAVDGVITDRPAPESWLGSSMGSWYLNASGRCIIISSGVVGIEGKGKVAQDFSLSYNKLHDAILGDLQGSWYQMSKEGFITLGRACNEDKWEDLGLHRQVTRSVELNSEHKRYYPEEPACWGDLLAKVYKSEPWDTELLAGNLVEEMLEV